MKKTIIFFIGTLLFTGCLEKYDLELEKILPRLVVEGVITNEKGPHYIRLTESHNGKRYNITESFTDNIKGVNDALIIITDNVNQIDTLVPVENIKNYELDYVNWRGYYKLVYDNLDNVIDTLWLSDPIEFCNDNGFYKTQNLIGIPGRTYSLKIVHQNKEYTASNYMPPVPEIDSVGYIIKYAKGHIDSWHPLLYFSEPQETKDYYLIEPRKELFRLHGTGFISGGWNSSIISDEFLQPYVDGLYFDNYQGYYTMYPGDSIFVRLSSLTKEAYLYYKALLQQFENDGGAFQPAPASPPTNISNGALGFFKAMAVSIKGTKIEWFENLSTLEVTGITATTAVSGIDMRYSQSYGGYETRGICWSTNEEPTLSDFTIYDSGIGGSPTHFSCTMTNLTPNTKYYVRAFVRARAVHYGEQREFTTLAE